MASYTTITRTLVLVPNATPTTVPVVHKVDAYFNSHIWSVGWWCSYSGTQKALSIHIPVHRKPSTKHQETETETQRESEDPSAARKAKDRGPQESTNDHPITLSSFTVNQAATTGPAPSRHWPSFWEEFKSQAQPQRRGISPNTMRASPKKRDPPVSTAKTVVPAPSSASASSSASSTSSASSASARVANYAPTVSAVRVGPEVQGVPLATTASNAGCGSVAKELIDAKRDEFVRLRRAWEQRVGEVDEALDRCEIDPLEIARGVTPEMMEKIPDAWLVGLAVSLNDDGVLELMDVEGNEHSESKGIAYGSLFRFCEQHGHQHGLRAFIGKRGVYDQSDRRPDCVLSAFYPPAAPVNEQRIRPFVVVEVEVKHRSIPDLIEVAQLYLSELHVHRVVAFKIFKSRAETGTTGNLRKAAVAIEFERDGPLQPGIPVGIRVVQEVSFGSAELDSSVPQNLCQVPSRTFRAGLIRAIASSPFEPTHIRVDGMAAIFPLPQHQFVVDLMPRFATPLTFDLRLIFQYACEGWLEDQT